jgi:hypothetical protein
MLDKERVGRGTRFETVRNASKPSVSGWQEGGRLWGGRKHAKTYAFVSETTFPATACKSSFLGRMVPFPAFPDPSRVVEYRNGILTESRHWLPTSCDI